MPGDDPDTLALEEDDLVGKVLDDRYRVDRLLGSGGMGRVYLGLHLGIDRTVAIKVLHTEFGKNRAAAERFQREALASGRLDHPNIISVSDFGVLDDGRCFLVMEALEGESLKARIDRDGAVPWPAAFDIIESVLRGLRHAHERGVVHRDIKPENIFLAIKDGVPIVKLLDFGIAKLVAGSVDDPTATRVGLTLGTPAYLSPEQAVGGNITPVADLYSTTVVLFELLTGHAPYAGETPLGMMISHISATRPRLHDVAPAIELPAGAEELVQRGLAKMPADRIASASEYLATLDRVRRAADAELAAGSAPGRESAPIAVPPVTDPRRAMAVAGVATPLPRRWFVIGGCVLALAAIVAIAAVVTVRDGAPGGTRSEPRASQPARVPVPASQPVAVLPAPRTAADREVELKALLHDLSSGRTCADRRAVIPKLVELGDARAVPALKTARHRMRGGVLGIGARNVNACLKADAEAAMRALSAKP